jgi:hypothetical protein
MRGAAMGDDVTMVDTSVFGALNRQNSGPIIAKDLQDLTDRGDQIVVCASAYQEILNTPDQNLKVAQLKQISDFKMTIQSPTNLADRFDLYNEHANLGSKPTPQKGGVELGDLPIVADVRTYMRTAGAKKVTLFTVERMVRNRLSIQRDYKIEFSDKSRVLGNLGKRVAYRSPGIVAKITPRLKVMGANLVIGAAGVGLALLKGYILQKLGEHIIKKDLEEEVPRQIVDELPKHRGAIAEIQSRGKQAYANATVIISGGSTIPVSEAEGGEHAPNARLALIEISEDNLDLTNRKEEYRNDIVAQTWITRYTFSFEVEVSDYEVTFFRSTMGEIERWSHPTDPAIKKLHPTIRDAVANSYRQNLVTVFGPLIEPEVLDAWMWPKFKKQ